jgi:hypothetical protein
MTAINITFKNGLTKFGIIQYKLFAFFAQNMFSFHADAFKAEMDLFISGIYPRIPPKKRGF